MSFAALIVSQLLTPEQRAQCENALSNVLKENSWTLEDVVNQCMDAQTRSQLVEKYPMEATRVLKVIVPLIPDSIAVKFVRSSILPPELPTTHNEILCKCRFCGQLQTLRIGDSNVHSSNV